MLIIGELVKIQHKFWDFSPAGKKRGWEADSWSHKMLCLESSTSLCSFGPINSLNCAGHESPLINFCLSGSIFMWSSFPKAEWIGYFLPEAGFFFSFLKNSEALVSSRGITGTHSCYRGQPCGRKSRGWLFSSWICVTWQASCFLKSLGFLSGGIKKGRIWI